MRWSWFSTSQHLHSLAMVRACTAVHLWIWRFTSVSSTKFLAEVTWLFSRPTRGLHTPFAWQVRGVTSLDSCRSLILWRLVSALSGCVYRNRGTLRVIVAWRYFHHSLHLIHPRDSICRLLHPIIVSNVLPSISSYRWRDLLSGDHERLGRQRSLPLWLLPSYSWNLQVRYFLIHLKI